VPDDLPPSGDVPNKPGMLGWATRINHARRHSLAAAAVNRWMSRQLFGAADRHLQTLQCGLSSHPPGNLGPAVLNTDSFEIESEMLMSFLAAEHPVVVVPIQVIGRGRNSHIIRGRLWALVEMVCAVGAAFAGPAAEIKHAGPAVPSGLSIFGRPFPAVNLHLEDARPTRWKRRAT